MHVTEVINVQLSGRLSVTSVTSCSDVDWGLNSRENDEIWVNEFGLC